MALRGVATSAIDLSDGLAGDLAHILRRSGVGAVVDVDALPRSAELAAMPRELQLQCTAAGGDDYELLFTAPAKRKGPLRAVERLVDGLRLTRIGVVTRTPGVAIIHPDGRREAVTGGYEHFVS